MGAQEQQRQKRRQLRRRRRLQRQSTQLRQSILPSTPSLSKESTRQPRKLKRVLPSKKGRKSLALKKEHASEKFYPKRLSRLRRRRRMNGHLQKQESLQIRRGQQVHKRPQKQKLRTKLRRKQQQRLKQRP